MTAPMFVMGGGRKESRLSLAMKRRPMTWVVPLVLLALGLVLGPLVPLAVAVVLLLVVGPRMFRRADRALGLVVSWGRVSRDIGLLTGEGRPFQLVWPEPVRPLPNGYLVRVKLLGGLTLDKAEACVPALAAEMGMPIGDVVTDGAHSLVFRLMEDGTN